MLQAPVQCNPLASEQCQQEPQLVDMELQAFTCPAGSQPCFGQAFRATLLVLSYEMGDFPLHAAVGWKYVNQCFDFTGVSIITFPRF